MLTPAIEDPKRKEELARAKQNPSAFGADAERPDQTKNRAMPQVGGLAIVKPKTK